jgi:hypothetical protein
MHTLSTFFSKLFTRKLQDAQNESPKSCSDQMKEVKNYLPKHRCTLQSPPKKKKKRLKKKKKPSRKQNEPTGVIPGPLLQPTSSSFPLKWTNRRPRTTSSQPERLRMLPCQKKLFLPTLPTRRPHPNRISVRTSVLFQSSTHRFTCMYM